MADELSADPRKQKILFVGNSLTELGIRPGVVARMVGPDVRVEVATMDDTTIMQWTQIVNRVIFSKNTHVDSIVLPFTPTHLSDGPVNQAERLGWFLAEWSDLPFLFRHITRSLADRVDLILGRSSLAYAMRMAIRNRVMGLLVPQFKATGSKISRFVRRRHEVPSETKTFETLALLARLLRERQIKLKVVAMPVPYAYDFQPGLEEACAKSGVQLIDGRGALPAQRALYLDDYHLSVKGAHAFSLWLGAELGRKTRQLTGQ